MVDAPGLALRLRSQFVAEPLYRRDGVGDWRASVSSLPSLSPSGAGRGRVADYAALADDRQRYDAIRDLQA